VEAGRGFSQADHVPGNSSLASTGIKRDAPFHRRRPFTARDFPAQ
jgi:hypothetical protein